MRTVGVICECNPPHAGHFYLLDRARDGGDACVICVMSGCFVQRGEAAILDPFARAELLVRAGADVVVELPYPYSASAAEYFGLAGVDILDRLGAEELWFGSERGELSSLRRLSELADSDAFRTAYRERVGGGEGTARAYFDLLEELGGETEPPAPNDILALSYLRAIRRTGSAMRPVPVKRIGSGYRDASLTEGEIPSATALRALWHEAGVERVTASLPSFVGEVLLRECRAGRAPARLENAERLILGTLRLADPAALSAFAGLGGGLAGRLCHAAQRADSLASLQSLAASKTYPDATVRRALLSALLGVDAAALTTPVAYVRLLAASRAGCAYLSVRRRSERLCVVTRRGDVPATPDAAVQAALEVREKALYSLLLPRTQTGKELLCHPPVIL